MSHSIQNNETLSLEITKAIMSLQYIVDLNQFEKLVSKVGLQT